MLVAMAEVEVGTNELVENGNRQVAFGDALVRVLTDG